MSNYNGANTHNVESILASIRSTIGDERVTPFRQTQASLQAERQQAIAEASEFELPAIFKPGHMQGTPGIGDARPNLFGRLSDALKPTQDEADRSRTVIRFQPAQPGRMIEPPGPEMSAYRHESAPAPAPVAEPSRNEPDPPRHMATFFDTRMRGMSSTPPPTPKPEPVKVEVAPPPPLPPTLPFGIDRADAQAAGGAMDDAAAQMLRPILRQWLTENMPKIVEKALQIESNGDLPRAPADPHAPPRKTLR